MPIQHAIWKVGAPPEALTVSRLATEKDLEDMITARPEMISSGWMLIGRQVGTSWSADFSRRSFSRWLVRAG